MLFDEPTFTRILSIITAAALLYPIAYPAEYPYPLPTIARDAVVELRAPFSERPGCEWVTEMYRKHRGAYAGPPA